MFGGGGRERCFLTRVRLQGEYNGHLMEMVRLLEDKGAGEDANIYNNIHTHKPALPPTPTSKPSKNEDELQRPATAAERPSSASKTRPASATKRPMTAKKFSTSDLIKSASGLFSVFERNKAQEEVRKLEEDVKSVEKVQAKLAKAERKAAVATEKAEKAHKELMARAQAFLPKVSSERVLVCVHIVSTAK